MKINHISGWVYPGSPCMQNDKDLQIGQYKDLDAVANEYLCFTNDVQPDGTYIKIRTDTEYGAGGYSVKNVKKFCEDEFDPDRLSRKEKEWLSRRFSPVQGFAGSGRRRR